ncbi:IS5 family transposase [Phyllobacterium sp. LjRoot231]|uniref:IS5 family transposase n=1 Tax=Phyllobacterium sp. LjRoot231 TaxID=3342289 RepID=UPI003ECD627C
MPFKHNAKRRHHIGKQKFKVTNWAEYEAGLRQRGSITFWFSDEALAVWHAPKRKTRGGQPRYSDLAIETSLTLGLVFALPLRQVEGFVSSVLALMGLNLLVPDHTTMSRRSGQTGRQKSKTERGKVGNKPLHVIVDSTGLKIYGAGQWFEEKHGVKARRQWRKLHIAINAETGEIIAEVLTDQDTSDVSQLETLLDQIDDRIDRFTADGAYDGQPTYAAILQHSPSARIIIPPRSTCVPKDIYGPSIQREAHITSLAEDGRMLWQVRNDYGKRSRVETTMSRHKRGNSNRLKARTFINQQAEASRRCNILNRMLSSARPNSVCVKATTA